MCACIRAAGRYNNIILFDVVEYFGGPGGKKKRRKVLRGVRKTYILCIYYTHSCDIAAPIREVIVSIFDFTVRCI